MRPANGTNLSDIDRYRGYLKSLAVRLVSGRLPGWIDSDDMVQQTLLQACQAWGGFRGTSDEELRAWLRKLLLHTVARANRGFHAQKRNIDRVQSLGSALSPLSDRTCRFPRDNPRTPYHLAVDQERAEWVTIAVTTLPDDQRQAILLYYWQGMTAIEVAQSMNKSRSAIAGLLHRSMKSLRTKLDKLT